MYHGGPILKIESNETGKYCPDLEDKKLKALERASALNS